MVVQRQLASDAVAAIRRQLGLLPQWAFELIVESQETLFYCRQYLRLARETPTFVISDS
jgi:hypothetical protein